MAVVGAGPVLAGLFDVYLSGPIQLPAQWCEDSRYKRVNNRVPGGGIVQRCVMPPSVCPATP